MAIGRMKSPTLNNRRNAWYQKRKHRRIPRIAESKKWLDAFYTKVSSGPISGGSNSEYGGFTISTFTANGTLTVSKAGVVFYEIVAAGGAGGKPSGGGGGAGEFFRGSLSLAVGTYPVVVGLGGVGSNVAGQGLTGGDSSALGITAKGGGGGGGTSAFPGLHGATGGSGGGAGSSNNTLVGLGGTSIAEGEIPPGWGNKGGDGFPTATVSLRASGGGGGAATDGVTGISNKGGNGGDGVLSGVPAAVATYICAGGGGFGTNSTGVGGTGGGGTAGSGTVTTATSGSTPGSGGGGCTNGTAGSGANGKVTFWIAT